MNIQKKLAILCGLTAMLSSVAVFASTDHIAIETESSEKAEQPAKTSESVWASMAKYPFRQSYKTGTSVWDWTKTNWSEGGLAEKTIIAGIPTLVAGTLYSYAPAATTLAWTGLKSILAYLAVKSLVSPKQTETSWDEEISNDLSAMWNWTKKLFVEDQDKKAQIIEIDKI